LHLRLLVDIYSGAIFAVTGTKQLPMVIVNGEPYYYDYRLEQLRSAFNPHDFVNLDGINIFILKRKEKEAVSDKK
jgi:hypothetical protein